MNKQKYLAIYASLIALGCILTYIEYTLEAFIIFIIALIIGFKLMYYE